VWFRNISGEVLHLFDRGLSVGPGGEFEWPGWDRAGHGVITGFVPVDGPGGEVTGYPEPSAEPAAGTPPGSGEDPPPAAGTGTPKPVPVIAAPGKPPGASPAPDSTGTPAGTKPAGETA